MYKDDSRISKLDPVLEILVLITSTSNQDSDKPAICSVSSETMDVDKDSDQVVDILSCWCVGMGV